MFVGRKHELDQLSQFLECAIGGRGTTVFISGEAGSGKTRLIKQFSELAQKKNIQVLTGWCLSNSAEPYFPFTEAFESFLSSETSSLAKQETLKTSLIELNRTEGQEITPQTWRDKTFAAITKELLTLSTNKPMIFLIDDLHWADSASLSLLHYISRAIEAERILIISTFREEELNTQTNDLPNSSPLVQTVRLMGREGLYHKIKLGQFESKEIRLIAENMLGGKIDQAFEKKLQLESHGNPLFIVESLRLLSKQGSIIQENNQWIHNIEKFEIPAKVKDVILRRLDALTPIQRKALNAASVIGSKFDPDLLAAVIAKDSLDILEELTTIAKATLLIHDEGKLYRFDHAKYQEMLYEEIPEPLKTKYHLRIAQKLEASNQSSDDLQLAELAYHYVQSQNNEKAIEYSLLAGKNSLARYSNAEAIKHFNFVLQTVEEKQEFVPKKNAAMEGLGDAFYANSMFTDALKTYEHLSRIASGALRLRALRKAMDAAFFDGDTVHLLDLTKKAEPLATDDRLETARIRYRRGRALIYKGNFAQALEDYEAALKISEEEYSINDVASELIGVGVASIYAGKLEKGIGAVLRSIALLGELGDLRRQMEGYWAAGVQFADIGLGRESSDMVKKAIEIGEKLADYKTIAESNTLLASIVSGAGDNMGALSKGLTALEYCNKTESKFTQACVYNTLVRCYTFAGDLDQAQRFYEKLIELPKEVTANPALFGSFTKAVFYAGTKNYNESNRYFEESIEVARSIGPGIEAWQKNVYSLILTMQGQNEAASKQLKESQKIFQEISDRFEHVNIQTNLMAPKNVSFGKTFETRIDIVNISRAHGTLIKIENIFPEFEISSISNNCVIKDNSLEMEVKDIKPLEVITIKATVKPKKTGIFNLNPIIAYIDNLGKQKISRANSVLVTVQPNAEPPNSELATKFEEPINFNSKVAEQAFTFLVKAFKEDYVQHKNPQEKSGWRTLMEVVKQGQVSKHSMYGRSGCGGQAKRELTKLGLIETRFFSGERGRGGRIQKIRICLEEKKVKQLMRN
jgi:tetratricopeptide (TPR) repeat protein